MTQLSSQTLSVILSILMMLVTLAVTLQMGVAGVAVEVQGAALGLWAATATAAVAAASPWWSHPMHQPLFTSANSRGVYLLSI